MVSVIASGAGQSAGMELWHLRKLGPLGDGDGFQGASLGFGQEEARGKVLQKEELWDKG